VSVITDNGELMCDLPSRGLVSLLDAAAILARCGKTIFDNSKAVDRMMWVAV